MQNSRIFRSFFFLGIFVFQFFTGCADKIVTENDLQPLQTKTAGNSNNSQTQFNKIQQQIFTPSCALSGCHGNTDTQANLNLTEGKAYSNLVNTQSILYPSLKRVDVKNPQQSLLLKVLYQTVPTTMPPGNKLSHIAVDSVAAWINRGAPND
ncbi:MAG: hypothetical protein ACM3RX_05690 [Methanococcaceae archaeon]